ncbi:MAG: response regulator [Acutalibacteraceae bacterium]
MKMYILAVDDEKLALSALSRELHTVFPEADIIEVQNPAEAVRRAKALCESGEKLDYAFLDIQMGQMSGLELAYRLKNIFPKLVLFFCTAYSEYAIDAFEICAKGYLLKPVSAKAIERVLDEMVTDWRSETTSLSRDIRVRTFGYFEVFVDGVPLVFEREKAKELFAFLIDRKGCSVTTEQIAFVLWEQEDYDRKIKNKTTAVVSSLRNTLKEAGIEDILVKSWNHLSIDTSKIKCDAYDFESGDVAAVNSFNGEYMANYSWAEYSTGKFVSLKQENKRNEAL